jgi:hypothetical protein
MDTDDTQTAPKTPVKNASQVRGAIWPWVVAFLMIECLVVFGVFRGRDALVSSYDSPEANADWQKWKQAAKEMGERKTGLINRREPKANQPPGLILMRDYFPQILIGSAALSGVLVGMTMLMVHGTIHQTPRPLRDD